jgi:hypothetical protein
MIKMLAGSAPKKPAGVDLIDDDLDDVPFD